MQLFYILLYQPLFNALIAIYNFIPTHDMGIAIVALTVLIKLVLYPLTRQSLKGQKALAELQPKIEAVKKEHANNREAQAKAMMQLYKDNKVNPLGSCLPLLIQLPILFAVYRVFIDGLHTESLTALYSFVTRPETLNATAFGFLNLATPNFILALLAGAAQFAQAKLLPMQKPKPKVPGAKDENMMAMMNKQMLYMMPIITVVVAASFPAGLALYWFVFTLLTAGQQWIMFQKKKPAVVAVASDDTSSAPQA